MLPAVRAKIASRRQNLHRQAVCAILASKGFAPDAIDTEISDNHDSYSSACFDHVTSLFQDLQGNLRAYPAVLAHLDSYKKLASCKPALGTRILQKIVKAAGLGKSATVAQLDKLDPLLCFAEDPAQGAEYDWYSLVSPSHRPDLSRKADELDAVLRALRALRAQGGERGHDHLARDVALPSPPAPFPIRASTLSCFSLLFSSHCPIDMHITSTFTVGRAHSPARLEILGLGLQPRGQGRWRDGIQARCMSLRGRLHLP